MKKIFLVISSIIILFIVATFGVYFFILHQIKTPLAIAGEEKEIVLEKGLGIKEIASRLEQEKIIKKAFYFEVYLYLKDIRNLQAGKYRLSPTMNIPKIVEIVSGGYVSRDEIKITIPEGFTVKQIDERLAASGLIKTGKIIAFENRKKNLVESQQEILFVKEGGNEGLEGYLFPDTYIFDKDSTVEEIVQKMIDNFNKKITPEMKVEIEQQEKTLKEIITIASIIQLEALSVEEMPRIAGVFYNRLTIGMPLQSDPTINYITGKNVRQVTYEDTQIDSPYNTYRYKGLPPGPICNPGLDAIKAAIWPEKNDYLYFLHPLNGPTIFSKTEAEHRENKAKWLK